jgi:hypothetical protein
VDDPSCASSTTASSRPAAIYDFMSLFRSAA